MRRRPVLSGDGIQVFIPPAKLESPTKKPAGMKVLIAEDDRDVRTLLHLVLRLDGHEVIEARSAGEVVPRTSEVRPDLVALDLTFPGSDGFSALLKLRENDETSTVPVIVISGRAKPEDQISALEAGGDVYLVKPFDPFSFMETVREMVALSREELEHRRMKELDRLRQLVRPAG